MNVVLRKLETPLGNFALAASEAGLSHCLWSRSPKLPVASATEGLAAHRHLDAAARALDEYFEGGRRDFRDLVLAPQGTPFQLDVWQALQEIPLGSTISYRELARRVGRPRAARAVGMANHHNPLVVIVPCHRVVAADGSLGGYGGGVARKEWLLAHEGARPATRGPALRAALA